MESAPTKTHMIELTMRIPHRSQKMVDFPPPICYNGEKADGVIFLDMERILAALGFQPGEVREVEPFRSEEDGEEYSVWKLTAGERTYVLKEAKEYEQAVYTTFLSGENGFAPRLYGVTEQAGKAYLLMEYIPGEDLRCCTREKLQKALDALIAMQKAWWERPGFEDSAYSVEKARPGRIRRGQDLGDAQLEKVYEGYLVLYYSLPRTLCHEDLLPFNLLITGEKAVLIDWEYAGMQPYLSSLARLIAHGEEAEDAFFHMRSIDRDFAIDYYYSNLVQEKGIPYADYRTALDYFLLYEYCEWIMLGVRYGDTSSERYLRYLALAREHVKHIKPIKEELIWK